MTQKIIQRTLSKNMKKFSKIHNFNFPYLIDETQQIAKKFGAVCTPDFFLDIIGIMNSNIEVAWRELKDLKPTLNGESDLLKAMKLISETNKGPESQIPSMGCNIKWKS